MVKLAYVLLACVTAFSVASPALAQLLGPQKPDKGPRPQWVPKTSGASYNPSKVNCKSSMT
jgi:hypothetical protein